MNWINPKAERRLGVFYGREQDLVHAEVERLARECFTTGTAAAPTASTTPADLLAAMHAAEQLLAACPPMPKPDLTRCSGCGADVRHDPEALDVVSGGPISCERVPDGAVPGVPMLLRDPIARLCSRRCRPAFEQMVREQGHR